MQKMADQERSDFYDLKLLEVLITSLTELIWVSNKKSVLNEAI